MKKRVAIDVGHARETGARGCGLEEHEVCVRIGAALATALRELGMEADVLDFPGRSNAGDMAETTSSAPLATASEAMKHLAAVVS